MHTQSTFELGKLIGLYDMSGMYGNGRSDRTDGITLLLLLGGEVLNKSSPWYADHGSKTSLERNTFCLTLIGRFPRCFSVVCDIENSPMSGRESKVEVIDFNLKLFIAAIPAYFFIHF